MQPQSMQNNVSKIRLNYIGNYEFNNQVIQEII